MPPDSGDGEEESITFLIEGIPQDGWDQYAEKAQHGNYQRRARELIELDAAGQIDATIDVDEGADFIVDDGHDLLVRKIDPDVWSDWKDTVPRSKNLNRRLVELVLLDASGAVQEAEREAR